MLAAGFGAPHVISKAIEADATAAQSMCGSGDLSHGQAQASQPQVAGYGSSQSTNTAADYSGHQNVSIMSVSMNSNSFMGLSQLQLPSAAVTSQLSTAAGSTTAAAAPSGITGMTSLYGKLRTQAVQPAAALMQPAGATSGSGADADAALQTAGPLSAGSAAGSSAYGWQRHKVLGSTYSSSNASSIMQAGAANAHQAGPFQYSLHSASRASTHSSRSTSSTCSRSTAASVHAADQALSSIVATPLPLAAHESSAAGTGFSSDQRVLEAFGLSSGPGSDQQQLLSLLLSEAGPMATAALAAHAAGTGAFLAAATGTTTADSDLLQQLQQLLVNETAAAAQAGPARPIHSSAASSEPASFELVQQQLLMQQLRDLQDAQSFSSSNTAASGSCIADLYSRADTSSTPTLPESGMHLAGALLGPSGAASTSDARFQLPTDSARLMAALQYQGLSTTPAAVQQQRGSMDPALLAVLTQQQQQGRCMASSSDVSSFAGLCSSLTPGAAVPLGFSNGLDPGHAAVADAVAALQHKILMGNSLAAAGADHGVFGSLAGLAAASAAAGLAGLGMAGKQTLQAGPGNNPMYKVGIFVVNK